MKNKDLEDDYVGTTNMHAKNQDMAFVNDTLDLAEDKHMIVNSSEDAEKTPQSDEE
ncbi:hypothetical protein NV379_08010 [Paenibacillus sp. N1-5-1-14]|uniref:hypothetical protein n=1 Tax=Paenibacillus radicibacter TaxID=2972488 RepID=UPI002158F0F9|nr:hypothetical protein [Paenibacillus radicibacter]MCR8642606.1 hypothetical protein [Paenibacillus radicibacter]